MHVSKELACMDIIRLDNNIAPTIIITYENFKVNEECFDGDDTVFVYESSGKKFIEKNVIDVDDEIYYRFIYPVFNKVDYNDFTANQKLKKSIDIFAYAKMNGYIKEFLIPKNVDFSFFSVLGDDEIENTPFNDVFINSGIIPLELPIDFDYKKHYIFKYKNASITLKVCRFPSHKEDSNNSLDVGDVKYNSALYYRDIFIKNIIAQILVPFDFNVIGLCINNMDANNRMALNVSRQGFVNTAPYIMKINYVLLKFFSDNKQRLYRRGLYGIYLGV